MTEPTVSLLMTGRRVSLAVFEWIGWLQARGHRVYVDAGQVVRVEPEPAPDLLAALEVNLHEVRAVLDAQRHLRQLIAGRLRDAMTASDFAGGGIGRG
jgi:hypothetical protein